MVNRMKTLNKRSKNRMTKNNVSLNELEKRVKALEIQITHLLKDEYNLPPDSLQQMKNSN